MKKSNTQKIIRIFFFIFLIVLISSCKKEDSNSAPIAIFSISPEEGDTRITFIFDASQSFDTEDTISLLQAHWDWEDDGTWDTEYSTDKIASHKYTEPGDYTVRMEIKDIEGMTGQKTAQLNITEAPTGTLVDTRDGKTYNTIQIGNKWWMSENLNYETPEGSWCYDKLASECEKYGRLYNWTIAANICPPGWHLPTDDEWKNLEISIGMTQSDADTTGWRNTAELGIKLKATNGWKNNGNGNDESGFTALPAGGYDNNGNFGGSGSYTYFWTSTNISSISVLGRLLNYAESGIKRTSGSKTFAYSIRCLKN